MPAPSPRQLRRLNTSDLAAAGPSAQQRGYDDAVAAEEEHLHGYDTRPPTTGNTTTRRKGTSPLGSPSQSFGATTAQSNAMEQGQEYVQSPVTDSATFGYPPAANNLKSRVGTSSPVLGRVRQRSPSRSASQSSGQGFIGGAFGRVGAGKHSATRIPTAALPRLFGRSSSRVSRGALLALAALACWLLWGRNGQTPVRQKLTTRWWESGTPEELQHLLPKPPLPPKPPKLKPPALTSHTLAQLSRLPSSFSTSSSADWTAVVHLTSSAQLSHLDTLIPSLLKQSHPPKRAIVLAADGLHPSIKAYGPLVSLLSYSSSQSPALALISAASSDSIPSDNLLVLDAALDSPLPPSYVKSLLRAAGTKEYTAALLSTGGIVLPTTLSSPPASCLTTSALDSTSSPEQARTSPIHIPTAPFLLQTTWLSQLANGLRADLPLEVSLALALWSKVGIPSFAVPVPSPGERNAGGVQRDWGCERIERSLVGQERAVGSLFRRELGAGGGLRSRRNTARPSEADAMAGGKASGPIVFLLSGQEEVQLVHPLACGLAAENDVRVYVADSGASEGGPKAFFLSPEADEAGQRCHLDLHPLGTGAQGESVSLLLVEELERIGRVEVAIYLQDGERGREFDEVMKWTRAVFGTRRGGRRMTRRAMDAERGTVVIALEKAEVAYVDWLAALPLEALRHWHTPRIDLSVLTNDRPKSLHRLLTSLQDAHYFGDDVSLSINLEQTADRVTQRIVDEFAWPVGTVALRHRIVLGGLMPAIVESWYPTSNDSYGVFLEDDVEVSPLFYGWLKFTILQYRYGDPTLRQDSARLFGVSLYQPKNVELLPEGRRPFDAHKLFASLSLSPVAPYLSQVPCSWGAVYFPEVWREFHSYLSLRLSEIALPISDTIVPDIKSNKWPRSWKKYFIELAYLRGYVMLYPNYASFFSLSTNHVEKGTHIKSDIDLAKRKALFEVPLMDRNQSLLALPEGRLPDWAELPLLDFWGSIATDEEVIERGWQTWSQLDTCKTSLRLDQPPTYNARELLCKRVYERVERLVEAQPLKPLPRLAPVVQGVGVDRPPLVVHPDAALGADVGAVGVVGDEEVDARAREGLRIDRELEARRAVGQGQGAILAAGVAPPSPVQAGPEQVELGDEEADIRLEDNEVEEEVETVEAVPVGEEAFEVEGEQERQEWAPVAQEEELLAEDGEGEVLNDERARK